MILKLYNKDVVDCSSSWNQVIPNPETRQLLVDIFLKICESDAVRAITSHSLQLDFSNSSNMENFHTDIEFKSPYTHKFSNGGMYPPPLSTLFYNNDSQAKEDKIDGLFIESETTASSKVEHESKNLRHTLHLLPPGLRGLRRAVSIIKAFYSRNPNTLPRFLHNRILKNFRLYASVIWDVWAIYREDPQYGRVLDGENDSLSADSETMELFLGSFCEGGQQGRKDGAKHYPDIQRVLEDNWPTLFEVQELNGG
ncbi:hypothetical protein LCGC14_1741450 [marine sediment metagenome]|uniref:Uncharacterized protein n=1 Tax=marine sediment metagenome TaxID=412755 RepID=A0A0F9HU60_9ZZZZ